VLRSGSRVARDVAMATDAGEALVALGFVCGDEEQAGAIDFARDAHAAFSQPLQARWIIKLVFAIFDQRSGVEGGRKAGSAARALGGNFRIISLDHQSSMQHDLRRAQWSNARNDIRNC